MDCLRPNASALDGEAISQLKGLFSKLVREGKIQRDTPGYESTAARLIHLYLSGVTDPAEMAQQAESAPAAQYLQYFCARRLEAVSDGFPLRYVCAAADRKLDRLRPALRRAPTLAGAGLLGEWSTEHESAMRRNAAVRALRRIRRTLERSRRGRQSASPS
jgi:hypothetical protein